MNPLFPNKREPEVPPDTCPYINFIQEVLEQIKNKSKSETIDSQIQLVNDTLEYIREANSSLRECGRFWKRKYDNKGKRKS
jgi:hypothetical protein